MIFNSRINLLPLQTRLLSTLEGVEDGQEVTLEIHV